MDEVDKVASSLAESGKQVRLGKGVVGRSSILIALFIGVLGIAAWRIESAQLLWVIFAGAGLILVWFVLVLLFCWKNPSAALLEGSEWMQFKRFELTAKGQPHVHLLPPGPHHEPLPINTALLEAPEKPVSGNLE